MDVRLLMSGVNHGEQGILEGCWGCRTSMCRSTVVALLLVIIGRNRSPHCGLWLDGYRICPKDKPNRLASTRSHVVEGAAPTLRRMFSTFSLSSITPVLIRANAVGSCWSSKAYLSISAYEIWRRNIPTRANVQAAEKAKNRAAIPAIAIITEDN